MTTTNQPDRCADRVLRSGILRGGVCELLQGHSGWHWDGGLSWSDENERRTSLAEPVTPTPAEPRRVVVCAKNDLPHVETANCVEARFNGVVQVGDVLVVEPLTAAERERAAYERGKAEGLRQATEGWEREWSIRFLPDGQVHGTKHTEAGARARAAEIDAEPVSRLVGPWEPDATPAESEGAGQ